MSRLSFRYGAMGSAKTLNLLAVAHNYRRQRKGVVLIKPSVDDRSGSRMIGSRAGLSAEADLVLGPYDHIPPGLFEDYPDCVLVDEAQFLSPSQVEELRRITGEHGIPVICYGLRTNFAGALFPGSKRLMELADSIEEIKTVCEYCEMKATQNMRLIDGQPVFTGPEVVIGGDESYTSVCWHHWNEELMRSYERQEND